MTVEVRALGCDMAQNPMLRGEVGEILVPRKKLRVDLFWVVFRDLWTYEDA